MPTYDYQCSTCGSAFELYQSFSEDALTRCPSKKSGLGPASCTSPGRGKVAKVFSAPGITFKGGGFYKTDSRSGTASSAKGSGSNGSTESASATSEKSTTDPAPSASAASPSGSAGAPKPSTTTTAAE
jgi:predicted nucleic acid-binding Zn ribbon protein